MDLSIGNVYQQQRLIKLSLLGIEIQGVCHTQKQRKENSLIWRSMKLVDHA